MALCRRHVFNRAVTMLIVVPGKLLILKEKSGSYGWT